MPKPPPPPEEIAQLMQFIANKTKNVTSPMSVLELCRQFKTENGSSLATEGVKQRIRLHRHRIHEMNEFNMDTKVKMMFALSTPIDARFLIEMKKIADVEVDDQQRIIHYKQKDGELELSGKHFGFSTNQSEQRDNDIVQFLAKKSETSYTPIPDKLFLREFKESTGCSDTIYSLEYRYRRVKNTIFENTAVNKNTKIKMMFISNTKLPEDILEELRMDAVVEVDKDGKITKYKANDGSLDLEGNHKLSSVFKTVHSDRWKTICQKADTDESKEDEIDDSNCQKGYDKKRIDLVRFLIEKTKNVSSPIIITDLAKDYDTKFKRSEGRNCTLRRIQCLRQRIPEMNHLDIHTKVKLAFALSASIDVDFLKEMEKDATVELDEHCRIKKYEAKDGKLELKGYHRARPWHKVTRTDRMKATVFNDSSIYGHSKFDFSQPLASVAKGRKRAREVSEGDDGESVKLEDDWSMDFDTNNADDFDYDPSKYELDMEHIPIQNKPETLIDVKTEVPEGPSTRNFEYHYKERFFDYNPPTYEKDLEHFPEEKKPENLIEVKTEEPDGPSTSNSEYNEDILTEPKSE